MSRHLMLGNRSLSSSGSVTILFKGGSIQVIFNYIENTDWYILTFILFSYRKIFFQSFLFSYPWMVFFFFVFFFFIFDIEESFYRLKMRGFFMFNINTRKIYSGISFALSAEIVLLLLLLWSIAGRICITCIGIQRLVSNVYHA